jgi:DNA invertase Pin-like site-specific DNA recombinase
LGLAAQRFEIQGFGMREGFTVKSWHRDAGAGADALHIYASLAEQEPKMISERTKASLAVPMV